MLPKSQTKDKIKEEAKAFTDARFKTAIHYVKRLYTKEEALQILEEQWEIGSTKLPYD